MLSHLATSVMIMSRHREVVIIPAPVPADKSIFARIFALFKALVTLTLGHKTVNEQNEMKLKRT